MALTTADRHLRANPDSRASSPPTTTWRSASPGPSPTPARPGQIKIISVDGIEDALKAVKSGDLTATVAQYPYAIGQMGVEACQAAAAGKTLPANVKAPVQVVTKANADKALAERPSRSTPYDDPFTALIGS